MKTFLCMLFVVVVATGNVKGALSAFYHAPGKAGSYVAGPSPVLVEKGQNGIYFDSPFSFIDPSLNASIFFFGVEDDINHTSDFIVFAPPPGEVIGVGEFLGHVSFENSRNYLHVGFDWSSAGRGLETSTSYIEVLEIEYSPTGLPTVLALDFYQFEETDDRITGLDFAKDRASVGSFRYNSSIPLNIPEPASLVLLGSAFSFFLRRRR